MGMIPEIEAIYPEGSDLTIINTFYQYPKIEDKKKIEDDYIAIVYKDNVTQKKHHEIIYKPEYTYYMLKDTEKIPDYNKLFIPRDKVYPISVPFTKLERDIAERTGEMDFYRNNIINGDKKNNKKLHTERNVFFSDATIEDHYRFKFANTYTNDITKLYKGFFDIEVDGKNQVTDFPLPSDSPINCVSFYDDGTDKVYTFILRNPENPLIDIFEKDVMEGRIGYQQIHDFIINSIGGYKKAEEFGLTNTTYDLYFFDDEIDLISYLFETIHRCNPDFCMGWNSSDFDLSFIIDRIIYLGYNPEDILCDKEWPVKAVKHYVDERHKNELAERGDYTFISGDTVFIDQMIQYASRRKSKIGSFKSFKLDDIGEKEAGVHKLDYHHITDSVIELPYLDFKTFVFYNIMDVIVQKCIEAKTNDLEYIFSKCVMNNTSYNKGHRQTVYLINRMAADWYKQGYIIGNNCNKWNTKPPKFLGALVGDPLHTNDFSKLKIDGRSIWVCDNLQDYDKYCCVLPKGSAILS